MHAYTRYALMSAAALVVAGGAAQAAVDRPQNDAVRDLASAKIGIVQAIESAQAATGGRATAAELESEHGRVAYEVEVVARNNAVLEVSIDAATGKVLAQHADEADEADEAGEADRD